MDLLPSLRVAIRLWSWLALLVVLATPVLSAAQALSVREEQDYLTMLDVGRLSFGYHKLSSIVEMEFDPFSLYTGERPTSLPEVTDRAMASLLQLRLQIQDDMKRLDLGGSDALAKTLDRLGADSSAAWSMYLIRSLAAAAAQDVGTKALEAIRAYERVYDASGNRKLRLEARARTCHFIKSLGRLYEPGIVHEENRAAYARRREENKFWIALLKSAQDFCLLPIPDFR